MKETIKIIEIFGLIWFSWKVFKIMDLIQENLELKNHELLKEYKNMKDEGTNKDSI